MLRRAGTSLSSEHGPAEALPAVSGAASVASLPPPPSPECRRPLADGVAGALAPGTDSTAQGPQEFSASGLTPASLKHLRRQAERLAEERDRLNAEVASLQALLRSEQGRVSSLQSSLSEAEARETALRQEVDASREREEAQERRARELAARSAALEESLSQREAERAALAKALEDQRELTKEVCLAADRQRPPPTEPHEDLRPENERLRAEIEALRRAMAEVSGAAEKAMLMSAIQMDRVNKIRDGALSDAITGRIQLSVSVPRVTLAYNNAPPLHVDLATYLSQDKIRSILDRDVFPHFEQLWSRVDEIDQAPDGTSKKVYCTRMLDTLSQSIQGFVMKAQSAESAKGEADGPPGLEDGKADLRVKTM